MAKYVYELPPIDYWHVWSAVNVLQFRNPNANPYSSNICFEDYKVQGVAPDEYFTQSEYDEHRSILKAIELIKAHTYWEGDGDFFVTALPNDSYRVTLCFAIKQSNNGSTFLCSDYPFEHLSSYLSYTDLRSY